MKRLMLMGAALAALILIGTTGLDAQHQMSGQHQRGGHMQMESQGGRQEQPPGDSPMMGRGMMGVPMMCQMTGAQMDPLGIVSGDQMDPKMMARMLQLRGDMLKAMGEVLLKHGKAMEETH